MTTTIQDLPEELVEEILSRVPARHLKRLRSTCKRWNLLFDQQRFATQHSVKAPKELKILMLTKDKRARPVSLNLHGKGTVPSLDVKSELSLVDPSSGAQFDLTRRIIHCDGFLVCPSGDRSRVVIWNPCTGQTRWIKVDCCSYTIDSFVMGYSSNKSYKVLCLCTETGDLSRIYDFSCDSWRILDQDLSDFSLSYCGLTVSVKGKAYWISTSTGVEEESTYLARFDFDSEKASLLVPLPYQPRVFATLSLSAVGDDKLSVLIQPTDAFRTEFWVTNKILDETTPVLWSLVFALDLNPHLHLKLLPYGTFLIDQDKKLALCCHRDHDPEDYGDPNGPNMHMDKVNCVGEDFDVTEIYSSLNTMYSYSAAILNYVPSLAQIEPVRGNKRRRIGYSTT